jgi:hypothetical protein
MLNYVGVVFQSRELQEIVEGKKLPTFFDMTWHAHKAMRSTIILIRVHLLCGDN